MEKKITKYLTDKRVTSAIFDISFRRLALFFTSFCVLCIFFSLLCTVKNSCVFHYLLFKCFASPTISVCCFLFSSSAVAVTLIQGIVSAAHSFVVFACIYIIVIIYMFFFSQNILVVIPALRFDWSIYF